MNVRQRFIFASILACAMSSSAAAQFAPAPGTGPGLPETIEAIDSARVTTRILYITAHPDDESSSVLTYLARGLHADVALLSLTRGEGGQNALGPEQAPQLGLIRTQELLAATRGYGVKLYFTRAKDFGFSKTPEETEKVWGDEVLREMVGVIRSVRPNIVINGWGGVHTGHGHHQAAGLLTPKAVQLAADKSFQVYPGCADCPEDYAWGSATNPVVILDLERGSEKPSGFILPVGDISPLWGKSWAEIGLNAFLNHRTQGISAFINSPFLRRPVAVKREDGKPFDPALLSRPLHELEAFPAANGCPTPKGFEASLKDAETEIETAHEHALALRWPQAAASMAKAGQAIRKPNPNGQNPPECQPESPFLLLGEIDSVRYRIDRALELIVGLDVRATADRSEIARHGTFNVTMSARCRQEVRCDLAEPEIDLDRNKQSQGKKDAAGNTVVTVDTDDGWRVRGWDIGLPEGLPLLTVNQRLSVEGYEFRRSVPVTHIAASSTRVDKAPLRFVPEYTLNVEPKQRILIASQEQKPFDVFLRIHSYATNPQELKAVTLDIPYDWTVNGPVAVKFDGTGDRYARLTVTPPAHVPPGDYELKAYARRNLPATRVTPSDAFSISVEPLPSMPTISWEEPAQCVVHVFDISVPANLRVGYIAAEGEPIPDSLRMLGISVELLDAQALAFRDLSKFDAIVTGNRAYELRSDLPGANQRLLDYAANGGTLVVQYNTAISWDAHQYAPYPAKIGNPTPRITDETAAVKLLKPDDALLNRPNKIGDADFQGWVQERGLYYWKEFDPKYTALLGMNDPGEAELDGGLVYTKYGKGTYIYTGLAFFRQLPEGVPGAFRLFVNLLSASREK